MESVSVEMMCGVELCTRMQSKLQQFGSIQKLTNAHELNLGELKQ